MISIWEKSWWFMYLATAGVALVLSQSDWALMPLTVMVGEIALWTMTLTRKRKRRKCAKKI